MIKAAGIAVMALAGVAAYIALTCNAFESRESPGPTTFRGRVVYVDDGDTIVVLNEARHQVKVRLASIDAPELAHTNKEAGRVGQPFAAGAKRHLEELVEGRVIDLRCPDVDRYGRSVCDLFVDGNPVDEDMVRHGWAWANEAAGGRYMRDPSIPGLEADARRAHLGLWAGDHPVPPWNWRKTCWEQHVCPN